MIGPALLLADPSPCLRWLVLRDLFQRPVEDPELGEINPLRETDPLANEVLVLQEADGAWSPGGTLASGRAGGGRAYTTGLALARLGFLGFDRAHPAVQRGANFLFSLQGRDGSWPLYEADSLVDGSAELPPEERYTMIPMQTAFPLRGLAACGYATDPRAERAFDWLLAQRLEDGAWPTGIAAGVYGRVAGYRRLPGSQWGCRTNTTAGLLCLALHPERRSAPEARRALDLLLGQEKRETHSLGVEVARLTGAETPRGLFTYFVRFDLALILWLGAQVGLPPDDARLSNLLAFIRTLQGEYGLWEYRDRPQVSRWLTFDLLRSLKTLEAAQG